MSAAPDRGLRYVVRDILDGRVMTREEVNAEIVKTPGYEHSADELKSGWGTLFKPLAFQGDICFGPNRGTRVTFARPEQLSPRWQPLPAADEAAPLVIDTYLAATDRRRPEHVRRWMARGRISVKQLKHWFSLVRDSAAKVDVDGEEMLVRTQDVEELPRPNPARRSRLLGGFDQWVLGPGTGRSARHPSRTPPCGQPDRGLDRTPRRGRWRRPRHLVADCKPRRGRVVQRMWHAPSRALEEEVDRLSRLVGRSLELDADEGLSRALMHTILIGRAFDVPKARSGGRSCSAISSGESARSRSNYSHSLFGPVLAGGSAWQIRMVRISGRHDG